MKQFAILLAIIFILADGRAQSVVAARMTNFTSSQTFSFLAGQQKLEAVTEQQFSKLEIIFVKKIQVDQVILESCGEAMQDGVDLYINYGDEFKFAEGGKSALKFDLKNSVVEAITINLRRNARFCLKSLSLEYQGRRLPIEVPQVFNSNLRVTGGPNVYQYLFDSMLNTFLKADSLKVPLTLELSSAKPIVFDQVMVWAGNFFNDIIFKNYGRPKELKVRCEPRKQQSFEVEDIFKSQNFKLKELWTCEELKIEFYQGSEGSEFKEQTISELRLMNADKILIPDISSTEIHKMNNTLGEFAKVDLTKILERQLMSVETPIASVVRLHRDGSFFIHGFDELAKEHESYYILGEFIPQAQGSERIILHLKGIKKSSQLEMDSLSCGRKCLADGDFAAKSDFFEEDLVVRKGKDGFYRIDTVAKNKRRRIDFTSVRFLLDHSL